MKEEGGVSSGGRRAGEGDGMEDGQVRLSPCHAMYNSCCGCWGCGQEPTYSFLLVKRTSVEYVYWDVSHTSFSKVTIYSGTAEFCVLTGKVPRRNPETDFKVHLTGRLQNTEEIAQCIH